MITSKKSVSGEDSRRQACGNDGNTPISSCLGSGEEKVMLDLDEGVPPSRLEPQFYQKLYPFLNPTLELPRLRLEPQPSPDCSVS